MLCMPRNWLWLHEAARYVRSTLLHYTYNVIMYGLGSTQCSMSMQRTVIWNEHSCGYGPAACHLESSTQTRKTEQVTFLVVKSFTFMIDGDDEWSMSRVYDATLNLMFSHDPFVPIVINNAGSDPSQSSSFWGRSQSSYVCRYRCGAPLSGALHRL